MRLPFHMLTGLLLLVPGCSSGTDSGQQGQSAVQAKPQKISAEACEAMLYELGAYPVSKLTREYPYGDTSGVVYGVPNRVDVNGWLPPQAVRSAKYLTYQEKRTQGIPKPPLSYERYIEIMDTDAYQRTKDPMLFLVIRLALQEFRDREIEIKNPEDLLKIYHARMGLDAEVLSLFKSRSAPGVVFARLYQRHQDPLIFRFLPPVERGQAEYRQFLEQQVDNPQLKVKDRFYVYQHLYQADKQQHGDGYQAFLISNVEQMDAWLDRSQMIQALLEIGSEESIRVVKRCLLNDPVLEVRKAILRKLKAQGRIEEFLDTLLQLSNGQCKPCQSVAINPVRITQKETVMTYPLRAWLEWAEAQPNLQPDTKWKVDRALENLTNERSPSRPSPYRDGVGPKVSPQKKREIKDRVSSVGQPYRLYYKECNQPC
ncbi:hypothetical protein Pan153_61630 [Gimesia panareensis]|uniref:Uncharacterized protein n=1 Tax=Gimesia panareensis TaxID=2527978 RepID=A0A518FYQ0_9PLAN|nr:hypothetical protein [Gimesia panareensis]QDV21475.1 hypothetical protein Pan153_61630 [Gimesia panareensis]